MEEKLDAIIKELREKQSGQESCREYAIALTKLEEAGMWIRKHSGETGNAK